jgi:CHASE3 domain sensor protein
MQAIHKKFVSNFLIFLIIVITVGNLITYSEYQNLFRVNNDILESGQTMRAANQAIISLHEAGMKVSAFIIADDLEGMKNLPETITSAQLNLDALKPLIQDTKGQIDAFDEAMPLVKEKLDYLGKIYLAYQANNKAEARRLASDKTRFDLTNKINQKILIIKKIEMSQLEDSRSKLHDNIIIANSLFMLMNIISIGLLIFCFYRITHDDRKR